MKGAFVGKKEFYLIKLTSWKLESSRWFYPRVLLPDAKQFLQPITSAAVHTIFLQQSII